MPFEITDYQRIITRDGVNLKRLNMDRFQPETTFASLHAVRYCWMINALCDIAEEKECPLKVVSVGCVPGVCEQIAKCQFGEHIELHGIGLGTDDMGLAEMPWFSDLHEFDIEGLRPSVSDSVHALPYADGFADAILAGEIIEHLFDPRLFWQECRRILRPGGRLILTTPNISFIGNIIHLLCGKSCLQNLNEYFAHMGHSWRPHYRIYSSGELKKMGHDFGFSCCRIHYLDNQEHHHFSSVKIRRKSSILSILGLIPHFRNNLVGVFQ